ncbi:MAG: S8 family serine peptidase [Myxococcaceae bacterium]|nr:S8 family serine peptidase [Myxococcaceae bacterium]
MTNWVKPGAHHASSAPRSLVALLLGAVLVLQGCAKKEEPPTGLASATPQSHGTPSQKTLGAEGGAEYVPGELLVHFKENAGELALAAHASLGAKVLHTYRMYPGLQLVSVDEASMEAALAAYQADPNVLYAEPNYIYRTSALPNDPRFGDQWGLHNTGQSGGTADVDINAPEAWDITPGNNTAGVIAVIDTGVAYNHPDLAANMWVNPGEIPGNNVDDDNNGYVDDVHGINAITNSGDPMDDNDHGTHAAGIIAARGDNAIGVTGVSWDTRIMACKFQNATGSGTTANAVKCLDYVHMMKMRVDHPANVIATNNSWTGTSSQALQDGIIQQRNDGTLFIAAAGNTGGNNDTTTVYPAGYFISNVISVAAHDRDDALGSTSNHGRRTVHVAAPGVGVLSTVRSGYVASDGTSAAAPHVAGLVALLKAQDPGRDWRQLKNLVLTGGVPSAAATGTTLTGNRLRAADVGGAGSLTCDNRVVASRVRPIADTVTTNIHVALQLAAYHLNCDAPAGSPTITIAPTGETITLTDNGQFGDEVAGDGLYVGSWEPSTPGVHTLSFPGGDTLTVNVVAPYVKTQVPLDWRTITGTNLALADNTVATVTSPFTIPFAEGAGQTSVRITMNGAISFTSTSFSSINATLPSSSHQTLIAPHWDNLYPGPTAADNVYWDVIGTEPHREFVVEWRNVHNYSTRSAALANTLLFQVVFFEDKPDILFNYRDVLVGNATYDAGRSATVGVQVSSTLATLHSHNTASLANDTAYLWTMAAPSQAPSVSAVTVTPPNPTEGDTVTVEASFTDPDGDTDAPWRVQIDTDFPGWFTPDLSQDVTAQGAITGTGVMGTSGDVVVAVRVQDTTGARSSLSTTTISVADVPPSLAPITLSGMSAERQLITFSTSFVDPGRDAPWRVEWDFDYDGAQFTPNAYSLAAAPGSFSAAHAFSNDGTYTVAARVTDRDGVTSTLQTVQLVITDLAPLLSGVAGTNFLYEGSPYELLSTFTDPGDHSLPWKIQWDLDYDGTTFDVDEEELQTTAGSITLSRFARDSGHITYALRVQDADGSLSQVQTIDMEIEEVSPILSPLTAQLISGDGSEPSLVTFEISASSGAEEPSGDPIVAYVWDFDGDGHDDFLSSSPFAVFTYRDNPVGGGAFTARVRVMDEDGYSEEMASVTIDNVPPTLIAPPQQTVIEGTSLVLRLNATDPGSDTLTFSVSDAPAGLFLSPEGLLMWSPTLAQTSGSGRLYTLTLTVTDDDGATDSQPLTLMAQWKDADSDGMADTWETAHGLDPSQNDAAGDADGDGINNLSEFRSAFEGLRIPEAAVAHGPLSGTWVKDSTLVLTTRNVANRGDLADVKYEFQLFADGELASKVCDATVDEATGETTSVTLPSAEACPALVLEDDHVYAWRARATDGANIQGAWSPAQTVRISTANDAPEAPRTSQPVHGALLSTDRPVFLANNAMDVDDTALTYVFEVSEDAALAQNTITSEALPGGANGSTSWTVSSALKPFVTYYWRVTATDSLGASTPSEVSSFVYLARSSNREPSLPGLVAPSADGVVSTLTPELVVDASTDVDGDALQYVFELDTSFTFTASTRMQSSALTAGQDGQVRWQTPALAENTRYYWRARAMDPYSASDWILGSFIVNAQNDPPSAPVAFNPSDAIVYTRQPTLIVQNATDPEGDAVTYAFEIRTTDGAVAVSGDNVAEGANRFTSFEVSQELEEGTEYIWVARAKDATGAVSAASSEARFQVYKAPETPAPPDEDEGCSAGAGSLGGLLPLLAMALGLLRRRRS